MNTQTETPTKPIRPGAKVLDGMVLWPDSQGGFMPEDRIKPELKIEDEMVLKIVGFAKDLSEQIARFKVHTFTDIADFRSLLAQNYGLTKGGPKGNTTFTSFDGLQRVEVKVAEEIEFGPQLQVAKGLIDECLTDWSSDARPELRSLVTRAFRVDKEGQVSRAELYRLRAWDIDDPRWLNAMKAITDATRVLGTKEYIRFATRPTQDGEWEWITINLASA